MRFDHWLAVMQKARDLSCREIQFIGGEVTLVPYLSDLVSAAKNMGFDFIEVFTNATLIDADLLEVFHRYRVNVATSFYCNSADVHDTITRRKGSWSRTMQGLEMLQARNIPVRVGIIEMPLNSSFVPSTVDFIKGLGITNVGVDKARSVGRGVALTGKTADLNALCGRCGAGRVCVTSSGEVFPCIMSRAHLLGNALSKDLGEIVASQQLANFRADLMRAKSRPHLGESASPNCTPDCWPHGGCSPHDACKPNKGKPADI